MSIPTIKQLYTGIVTDLQTQYGDTLSTIGKVLLRATAGVQAGKLKLYYVLVEKVQKNLAPDTADPESMGGTLERFGRLKIGRNPYPASAGQYTVRLNGKAGAVIPANTTFKSDDGALNPGILFVLDNTYTMISDIDTIVLRSLTLGLAGSLNVNDTLTATAPIIDINSSVPVISIYSAPIDAENIEDYRRKVISSYRLSPQGGSPVDFRSWAAPVTGVALVYPYRNITDRNEVDLYVEATLSGSTDSRGTPSAAILAAVQSAIELNPDTSLPVLERGRRPMGVWQVNYLPVTIVDIGITITGLTAGDKSVITAAVLAAINAKRPFVSDADVLENKNDILDVNNIIGVIITAQPGAIFSGVTITINGTPQLTYTFTIGNIPYISPSTGVVFP